MLQKKSLSIAILSAVFGVSIGLLIARQALWITVYVDYATGQLRQDIGIGPIKVRSESLRFTIFDNFSTTGFVEKTRDWHPAFKFYGDSRYSPQYQGGRVYNLAQRFSNCFQGQSIEQISSLQAEFLFILKSQGIEEVQEYVSKLEQEGNPG
jgi:hypothetical protein